MANTALGHHRNRDVAHDLANDFGRRHTGHATLGANLGGDPLQGHNRGGSGLFRDLRLGGVCDVHDDAAFEHLSQANLQP